MKKRIIKAACAVMACTLAAGALTSCGSSKRAESDTITVLNMGAEPEIDMDADYYPILDELTQPFGKKFRVEFIAWGEEKSTLQTRIAGGNYDATVIGPWSNYVSLAQSNAFYDLNKVIDKVPELVESYGGKEELKKLEINGKLNYIPQYTTKSPDGATYRLDLAEKWGIDVTDYDSLEKYIYKAKEEFGRPMMYSNNVAGWIVQNFIALTGTDTSAGLADLAISSTHDDPYTAVFVYELPEYKQALEKAKQWYDDGITDPDVLNTTVDAGVMLQDGLIPVHLANHVDSARTNFVPQAVLKLNGGEEGDPNAENPNNIHFGFLPYYPKDTKMFDQNMGNTTGLAINASVSDETAEAIIKFVEAAHTDKEFFDKYQYGKEGVSYESFRQIQRLIMVHSPARAECTENSTQLLQTAALQETKK